jgi:hypothetical protein
MAGVGARAYIIRLTGNRVVFVMRIFQGRAGYCTLRTRARGGRPSKYETEWKDKLAVIQGWARDGLSDEQIAKNMGISRSTLAEWKKKYS